MPCCFACEVVVGVVVAEPGSLRPRLERAMPKGQELDQRSCTGQNFGREISKYQGQSRLLKSTITICTSLCPRQDVCSRGGRSNSRSAIPTSLDATPDSHLQERVMTVLTAVLRHLFADRKSLGQLSGGRHSPPCATIRQNRSSTHQSPDPAAPWCSDDNQTASARSQRDHSPPCWPQCYPSTAP
jgi:hypothetical protein